MSQESMGPYRLLERLGRGSMGVVWKAVEPKSGALVALKILTDTTAGDQGARRFRREFRAAQRLNHPNIVRVLEFHAGTGSGMSADTPLYFTMEYVEGSTLRGVLAEEERATPSPRNTPAWVGFRLRLLHEAALALEHIHAHGVLHRDLKPTNLLVARDGRVKVADFGLARLQEPSSSVTRQGHVVGSLPYMAPEQIRGGALDMRTDVYGLGAVFYECLAYAPPFPEKDLHALLLRQLYDNPASPRVANPGLDPLLESLALRCLAKDPLNRPQSARELIVEVEKTAERLGVSLAGAGEHLEAAAEMGTLAPQLVGREGERRRLRAAIPRARAEGCFVLLLVGPSGVGKTRLTEDVQAEIRLQGFRLIASRCPLEPRPLGAFAAALAEAAKVLRDDTPRTESHPSHNDAALLAKFLPQASSDGAPTNGDAPPRDAEREAPVDRVRAVWAAEGLLRRLAEKEPVALVLDDLQGADPLSLDLLERLALESDGRHRAGGGPIPGRRGVLLVLATLRSEALAAKPALEAAVEALCRAPSVEELKLGPLDEDATGLMVQSILGAQRPPRRLVSLVFRATGGLPSDVQELVRALVAKKAIRTEGDSLSVELPLEDGMAGFLAPLQATRTHMAGLPPAARRLLAAAALLGPTSRVDKLGKALELDEESLLDALDLLIGRGLLADVPGSDAVAFPHDRIREAVLSSVTEEELRSLQTALARTIEREGGSDEAVHRAAELFRAAGSIDDARRLLPLSAEAYARAGLLSEALVRYEELLVLLERAGAKAAPAIERRRAELLAAVGRMDDAVHAFRALADQARVAGDPVLLSDALREEAHSLELLGRYPEALALLGEAREEAENAGNPARKAAAIAAAGHVQVKLGRYDLAAELHRDALEIARGAGDAPQQATALHNLGLAEWYCARYGEALRAFEEAWRLRDSSGDRWNAATTLINIGHVHLARGETRPALDAYERALAAKRAVGDLAGVASALRSIGALDAATGDVREAATALEECLAIRSRFRDVRGEAIALVNLGELELWRGRRAEAERCFERAQDSFRQIGERMGEANALLGRGLAAWERRDDAAARRLAEEARALADSIRLVDEDLRAADLLARLDMDRGDAAAAVARLEPALERARASATKSVAADIECELVVARALAGERASAVAAAEELVQSSATAPRPLRARSLLAAAAALQACGRADRATALLDEATGVLSALAAELPEAERPAFLARREVSRLVDLVGRPVAMATAEALPVSALDRYRTFHRVVLASDLGRPDSLLESFLDVALEATGYEKGFVFLADGEELSCRAARGRAGSRIDEPEARVPRQVLRRVLDARLPIQSIDAAADPAVRWEESIADLGVRAFAAIPLHAGDRALAVAYFDAGAAGTSPAAGVLDTVQALFRDLGSFFERAREVATREERAQALLASQHGDGGTIVGASPPVVKLVRLVATVAASDATILIEGEDGTGKELVAREIHARSRRADRPLVAVNCGALAESLLESELFGHVRGAFTGAVRDRMGVFQAASSGTLFLDEVGEMSPALQVKLLRVLESGDITRVGSSSQIHVDVRLVAATNRELAAEVKSGRFRKDLFYRLKVVGIRVPPLRERRGDIPLLAHHFLRRYVARAVKPLRGFTHEAMRAMGSYSWPGNVRELENVVERAVVLAQDETDIGRDLLPEELLEEIGGGGERGAGVLKETMEALEKRLIERALEESEGNRTRAAHALGMSVRNLQKKLGRYGIE